MSWPFIAREDELEHLVMATNSACGGPLVITGEPRMGRTTLLRRATATLDKRTTMAVRLERPGDRMPFAALAPSLPQDLQLRDSPTVDEITRAFLAEAGERLLVVVADDAHLVDQHSMLVARELHRRAGAVLLASQPTTAASLPDPLDCLRHEPGLRTLPLPPLRRDEVGALVADVLGGPVRPATVAALHAATHGNPGLLHDLLVYGGLADHLEQAGDGWQLSRTRTVLPGVGLVRLREATEEAWRALDLDCADELCRLSTWSGLATETAPTWAVVLLLAGRHAEGLAVLDAADRRMPEATLARALLLALGHRRQVEADELLAAAVDEGGPAAARLLAARAWLLAVGGHPDTAAEALAGVAPEADREAYVFALAARAVVAGAADGPKAAVAHLRRALLAARISCTQPWLVPYLTASLIDALLLAGRISEATAVAADFHFGQRGSGWRVAVGIADLMTPSTRPVNPPAEPAW